MVKISSSEITPEHVFLNRRKFMIGAGSVAGALALSACAMPDMPGTAGTGSAGAPEVVVEQPLPEDLPESLANTEPTVSQNSDELGDPLNSFDEITNYNNYYEFTTNKEGIAELAEGFVARPWEIKVTGLVNNPLTLDVDDVLRNYEQREHIFRLRCVEAWSMVIPWIGFSMGQLLRDADPKSEARYVKFTSVYRPEEMPGQRNSFLKWPYVEGLRVDEAMNDLAIFATGMYGKLLENPNGAPFRMMVPWKYGFKSIKGIAEIELTDEMPQSTWMQAAPNEYGFYANVNPEVNHPRWSQATERRIGEGGRRETLMFNGYAEEVAHLYTGMDLQANF
ncbi:MAG: protein-methionine-sulfoxide reductase catalytic subunit MsrP [Litorilinea sp.]